MNEIEYFNAKDPETGETFREYMRRTGMSMESALRGFELASAIQERFSTFPDASCQDQKTTAKAARSLGR